MRLIKMGENCILDVDKIVSLAKPNFLLDDCWKLFLDGGNPSGYLISNENAELILSFLENKIESLEGEI